MTTTPTNWHRCPFRRSNLISGPKSAFARLFPEKYRQQEINRAQRSRSNDNRYRSTDRIISQCTSDDEDKAKCQEQIRKSRRVKFYNNEDNCLKTRARSEPYLDRIQLSSEECSDYDLNPEIICHDHPDDIVYTQKVGVRYLRPPTPPPPGPIVIREIQPIPPKDPSPIFISGTP